MHKQTLILLPITLSLNLLSLYAAHKQPDKFPLPPEIEVHKLRLEKRALEQAMLLVRPTDNCPCLGFTGKKLIACMDYADKKEVRSTFAHMTLQARIDYLLKMDLLEYKRFLDAFENEQQWLDSIATLSPDEQKLLPQTMHAQLIMIRDTWISCAPRKVGMYATGSKDPDAKDIAAWRNRTFEHYERMKENCPVLLQWLNERFTEQKIKLFYERKKQTLNTGD